METYIDPLSGEEKPKYIILSGEELKAQYISRATIEQFAVWTAAGTDPNLVDSATMLGFQTTWKAEAESLYPLEGSYRITMYDETMGVLSLGAVSVFVGDESTGGIPSIVTYPFNLSASKTNADLACAEATFPVPVFTLEPIAIGTNLYTNTALSGLLTADGAFVQAHYKVQQAVGGKVVSLIVGGCGNITSVNECGTALPPPAPAPTCPDQVVVIQVCNSNSAKDDNFEMYVNGTSVGDLILEQNAQVGSVFLATTNLGLNVTDPDFACPMTNMIKYNFNPSLLVFGTNTIEMRNRKVNNNGNAGSIGIRSYQISGSQLINPCPIADLYYSGVDGTSFTFTFNYVECCGITTYPAINVVTLSSAVDQCGPGADTKIVTSSITLSSPVTVNTEFVVETFYNLSGDCVGNSGSTLTYVNIAAGQTIGNSIGCFGVGGAPSFPSEITAVICYQNIISHDNLTDNIVL